MSFDILADIEFNLSQRITIYAVKCLNFTKIGITADIDRRIASFTVMNPLPITRLMTRTVIGRHARRTEKAIHVSLRNYHHRGEWFVDVPDEVVRKVVNSEVGRTFRIERDRIIEQKWSRLSA